MAIGASHLGASFVTGIDIDTDALNIAQENVENCEADVELIQGDIMNFNSFFKQKKFFDTVIMV